MSNIIKQSFRLNIFILETFYLCPPEKPTSLYTVRKYSAYMLIVVIVPVLSILHILLANDLDMDRANYDAAILTQITCFTTKFLPFILNGQRIKNCIYYFENATFKTANHYHKNIINKCIKICRRNTFVFFIGSVGGAGNWISKPLFWKGRHFPADVWLPFNAKENTLVYWLVYLFVGVGPFLAGLINAVVDPLIAGLAYHATSQMKILKDNLQNLWNYTDDKILKKSTRKSRKQKLISDKVKECICHHDAILRFVREFEECFSLVLFTQMAGTVFALCFCCLQLGNSASIYSNFGQFVMYSILILIEIYFYCYYGSTLSEESNSLRDAIYMGEWYNYDIKIQKTLLTLMERSKVPVTVTAGKIVDLSLITFTTILRRSYSLIAVMKNFE